jgi:hypothetical protein
LKQLQFPAYAVVAMAVKDCSHVGMEKRFATPNSGNRHGESDEFVSVERSEHLPAGFRGDNK